MKYDYNTLVDFCKENKIPCLGLSDTSNLCGALEFAENISKVGTQPIIGTQINFKYEDTTGLLPLIALNEKGYKRIINLSSKSYLENDNLSDPHLDIKELLIEYTPNVITALIILIVGLFLINIVIKSSKKIMIKRQNIIKILESLIRTNHNQFSKTY